MRKFGKVKRKNSSSTVLKTTKTPNRIRRKVTKMFEEGKSNNVNVIFEREEESSDNSKESLTPTAKEKAIFNSMLRRSASL